MLRRFYCPELTQSQTCELDEREAFHARSVLRLKAGDKAELFDGLGNRAEASFIEVTKKRASLARGELVKTKPTQPEIHIAQAVPHKKKIDDITEQCEELGVSRLILIQSQHTVFDFNKGSFEKMCERLRHLALEGAKQSRNNYLMKVEGWLKTDALIKTFVSYSRVFLMSPTASFTNDPFSGIEKSVKPILILIGPEGGFSDEEEARFKDAGAVSLTLGDILLKCDTAAVASVSVLKYLFRQKFGA